MDIKWNGIVDSIKKVAPLLGTLIGGPAGGAVGAIAGSAVSMVASALGVEPTQEAIADVLANNPDAYIKLRELEMANTVALQQLVLQQQAAEFADTADARKRQVEHEKATGKTDANLYLLAWTIIFGFFGLTLALLYFGYAGKQIEDKTGVLFMLLGTLSTAFGMVVGYFFGSSKSSAEKSAIIAKASAASVPPK